MYFQASLAGLLSVACRSGLILGARRSSLAAAACRIVPPRPVPQCPAAVAAPINHFLQQVACWQGGMVACGSVACGFVRKTSPFMKACSVLASNAQPGRPVDYLCSVALFRHLGLHLEDACEPVQVFCKPKVIR
jgi:hypothetical protein